MPLIDRARWRRNGAYAAGCCVRAVDLIHSLCGARANYLDHDLQRQHRDIHAAAHQIHLSWDINGAEFGRIAAGLKPTNALLVGGVRYAFRFDPLLGKGCHGRLHYVDRGATVNGRYLHDNRPRVCLRPYPEYRQIGSYPMSIFERDGEESDGTIEAAGLPRQTVDGR